MWRCPTGAPWWSYRAALRLAADVLAVLNSHTPHHPVHDPVPVEPSTWAKGCGMSELARGE